MGATTTEVASSHVVGDPVRAGSRPVRGEGGSNGMEVETHVVMLSQPQVVIDVIRKAVKAAQG